MKVCYVLPKYDESTDEHYRYLYELLDDLACEVDLLVVVEKAGGPVTRPWPRVRVVRSSNVLLRAFQILWFLVCARVEGCGRFYVHYSYYGGVLAGLLCLFTGARCFYWNCGLAGMYLASWRDRGALRAKLRNDWPLKLSLRLATHLVTGTPTMAWYYEDEFGVPFARTQVVPNWVNPPVLVPRDEARRKLGLAEDASVILFLHHLSPRKGSRRLPELAHALAEYVPNSVFLVAGDGPDREWLARQSLPMRLLGRVPNREVSLLYRAADVLVVPSEEEGFPRVLLEAMSHRLPFVVTNVGGVRDVVPERVAGSIVSEWNTVGFVGRVCAILRDPSLRLAHALAWDDVRDLFSRTPAFARWKKVVLG